MAFALHIGNRMSHSFETLSLDQLSSVGGGQAQQQGGDDDDRPATRTWGQIGREYAAACVTGAGQSFLYGGRPRSVRQGLAQAAIGCGMGMGMRGLEDLSGAISGNGNQGY